MLLAEILADAKEERQRDSPPQKRERGQLEKEFPEEAGGREIQSKVGNLLKKGICWDFPGGAVVKNPPASAGDRGSSPGLGRSHMPRSS